MNKEQLERICFNCSHFFSSRPEASEYGICLEDDDFEPFIDELLLELNFSCCQELIDAKEFPGDNEACDLYEEAEIYGSDDDWWDVYWSMSDDGKLDILKSYLVSEITDTSEHVEITSEVVVNMFDTLLRRKDYGQMLELENLLYGGESKVTDKDKHYIDYYCLKPHLFSRDIDLIKRSLQSFIEDPVESIDLLIPLLDKLNYLGYSDLAVQISEEVYDQLSDSDELVGGAGEDFASTVLMYEFQKLYQSKGQTSLISREELINRLALYDYSDPELLGSVYEHLLSDTDCSTLSYGHFKANKQKFYHALSTCFYKYVFEEKGINFATANDFWVAAWSCFDNDTEEESGSLDDFFKLNYGSFDDYVHDRFGILSNKKPHAAAVLWGLPYVYDFLRINQLVSEETALLALQHVNEMKMELIDGQEDAVFDYSFVHSWGRPESVDEDVFLREKEFFERAFYEIVDVKEYLPEEYYIQQRRSYIIKRNEATAVYDEPKTGRNEPCPCGSGKKFKKCCGQG